MANKKFSDELAIASAQNIEEEKYWLSQFSSELVKCSFPYDYLKKTKYDRTLEVLNLTFPHRLVSKLMSLTNRSELRMFITLTAGLVVLLNKYTHQNDIIIGTSIYKQDMELEFINTVLALRNAVTDDMTFKELLMQVGKVIFGANKHQNYPIETLLHLLDLPFVEDEDFPLFDVALLLENLHEPRYLSYIHLNMIFVFRVTGENIVLKVEYNSSRYMKSTINRIASHFINLLTNAVFSVDSCLADIDVMSEKEKKEILFDVNDTKAGYSRDKTMHLLFEEQVEKTPNNIAVISMNDVLGDMQGAGAPHPLTREHHLTYRELNKKSNRLARELRQKGVKPNTFVGVIIDRSKEIVVGVMAILKAGGAYVPLEPYLPDTRIITCLASLNVECILTNRLQSGKIDKIGGQLPGLKHTICLDKTAEAGIEENSGDNLVPAAAAADIAYVIFTSGTTGVPKGVVEQHRPVINICQWVNNTFQVNGSDKLLFVASLSFDLSVYDIFGTLAAGGSIRLVGSEEMKLPDRLLEVIFEEGITFWDSAPAALQQLIPFILEHKEIWQDKSSGLKLVFLSGDWIPVTMPDVLKEVFKGVNVIALGGATEATIWSNFYPIGHVDPNWNSIPYGKPIQNAKYYILNRHLQPCPIGVPGDLYIGGECLASGYINDKELSSNKFLNNPFSPGEIMYKTGDMAQWFTDGNIEFLGRQDNQVKIRGYRIELGEIESQLLKHDQIKAAVVLPWGEVKGNRYLCGYYVAERDIAAVQLGEFLAKTLPGYMIPSYYVKLDKMPVTSNGKLDRKAFPEPEVKAAAAEYIPPRDENEKTIVDIWAGIIGIKKNNIGIDSDFFELGGHSLNAVSMVSKIHRELNVKLSLVEVFTKPTIRALAEYIKAAEVNIYDSVKPVEKMEYYLLSSAQRRMYLVYQVRVGDLSYNTPEVWEVEGKLDKERLVHAVKMLIQRHEAFRTTFRVLDEKPIQEVHHPGEVDFQLEYTDISGSDSAGDHGLQAAALNSSLSAPIENIIKKFIRPFDLIRLPGVRVGLVKLAEERYILMYDFHHIIRDGVSATIFIREFINLYQGRELPPLKLQYKDFAQWQNKLAQSGVAQKQEDYWLRMFSGKIPLLNLPLDYPRPSVQSYEGDFISFTFPPEKTEKIYQIMQKSGATLYMVILAMYNILLSKFSGQEDIIVGTPTAGRPHAELENLIGMFVNTLALRNYPRAEKTFMEFLGEVKTNTLGAFDNQDCQFEDLVNKLGILPDTSRHPLFDTMFVLQNVDINIEEMQGTLKEIKDLIFKHYQYRERVTQFDIIIYAHDARGVIAFKIRYSTKIFKKETMVKIVDYFQEIAASVLKNMYIKLEDIKLSLDFVDSSSSIMENAETNFAF